MSIGVFYYNLPTNYLVLSVYFLKNILTFPALLILPPKKMETVRGGAGLQASMSDYEVKLLHYITMQALGFREGFIKERGSRWTGRDAEGREGRGAGGEAFISQGSGGEEGRARWEDQPESESQVVWREGDRKVKVKCEEGPGCDYSGRQAEGPEGGLADCGRNPKNHRSSSLKTWTRP